MSKARKESEETIDNAVTEASTNADHQISGSSKEIAEFKKVNATPAFKNTYPC